MTADAFGLLSPTSIWPRQAPAPTDTRDCINVASTIELKGLAFIAIPNKWIESFRGYSIAAVGQMRCTTSAGQGSMSMAPRGSQKNRPHPQRVMRYVGLPYMTKGSFLAIVFQPIQ